MKKSYLELLKDPKWQKKRLEIFDRRNWACDNCGCLDKQLHVHHGAYLKGRKPWEYPDAMYHCLCLDCHEEAGFLFQDFISKLGTISYAYLPSLGDIIDAHHNLHDESLFARAVISFCDIVSLDERAALPCLIEIREKLMAKMASCQKSEDDGETF